MKKADIYFNGQIINTVYCDGVHSELSKNAIFLVKGKDIIPEKVIAIIPFDHLIIFSDYLE